jgi:hypothetical protein
VAVTSDALDPRYPCEGRPNAGCRSLKQAALDEQRRIASKLDELMDALLQKALEPAETSDETVRPPGWWIFGLGKKLTDALRAYSSTQRGA